MAGSDEVGQDRTGLDTKGQARPGQVLGRGGGGEREGKRNGSKKESLDAVLCHACYPCRSSNNSCQSWCYLLCIMFIIMANNKKIHMLITILINHETWDTGIGMDGHEHGGKKEGRGQGQGRGKKGRGGRETNCASSKNEKTN